MIAPRSHLNGIEREDVHEPSRMFKYRLDRNERNQPFSDELVERIRNKISGELFMVYPELDDVYNQMAEWLKVDRTMLALHAGSDQAIKSVFETYINPGDRVVLHFPGYAMYDVYSKVYQADVVRQSFDSNLNFDWDKYYDKIERGVRLVVVENPNGFVGVVPSFDKLKAIIQRAENVGSIILVDEAYFHFYDVTVQPLVNQYSNLIISRTFSKAFGLAGLRAGYLISQKENIANIRKVRPVYEITAITALVIREFLSHRKDFEDYVADTKNNLKELQRGLIELGIKTSDSRANFVAARLGKYAIHEELRNLLAEQGILIRRPFREEALQNWIRISTAPKPVLDVFFGELKKILKRNKSI